ncbi:repressor of the inhibitor of the kinase-like protein, partial [Aphelenchoides avenae]
DNDFGIIVERGREGVSREEKRHFLENAIVPPETYQLPYEERLNTTRGRVEKRYLKHSDLRDQRSRWISFSPKSGGLFRRPCFFFSTVRNSSFVDKPFSRWKNIWCSGKGIDCYIEKTYHIDAVDKALSFLDPSAHISANIDEKARRKQELGRKTLRTNIEAAIFLAKLGLPFRGHIDYGAVPVIENIERFVGGQGNFPAMLQFGALKNNNEKKTLVEASKIENQESKSSQNAQYHSPMIQNEIID